MASVTTCDHCGKTIERMRLELRHEGPIANVVARINYGETDTDLNGDFCDLPCLTGWAMSMADRYGYGPRIPPPLTRTNAHPRK